MNPLTEVPGFFDRDWWLLYGLQGLTGAVIGAAATGLAVWLTLRHEREQAQALARDEREQAQALARDEREQAQALARHDREQIRALVARETASDLQLALGELTSLLEQDNWDRPRAHELYRRTLSLASRLSSAMARDWPMFSEWVWKYRHNLTNNPTWPTGGRPVDPRLTRADLARLDHLVEAWFRDPQAKQIPPRAPQDTPAGERF